MIPLWNGDLARSYMLGRQSSDLKTRLASLAQEMGSGRKADLSTAVGGDYRVLAGLEHTLQTLSAYGTSASEAALLAQTQQEALNLVQTATSDLGPSLLSAASNGVTAQITTAAGQALGQFDAVLSGLNVSVGGQYAFSGDGVDHQPLPSAQDVLDTLGPVVAGQTTVAGLVAAVDAWFDAPPGGGGFLDQAYGGSQSARAQIQIGPTTSASITITAADPALRGALKGLALSSLVAQGSFSGSPVAQAAVLSAAGTRLIDSGDDLTGLMAELGVAQQAIEGAQTQNSATASALEIARNTIVTADPYETATALQSTQQQLEALYTVTARLANMTLADYMR